MTDFPASKKTFSQLVDGTTYMEGTNVNQAYDEVEAIQTFLGQLGSGNTQSYSAALLATLNGFQRGAELTYKDADEVTVAAGAIVFEAGGKYRMRVNTTSTDVGWGDIDTGAEANTTYYVYAIADAEATTFTLLISTQSDGASISGSPVYWKQLGSFVNATDITESSVVDNSATPHTFGSWVTRSVTTTYQALTDGFFVGYQTGESNYVGSLTIYTDSNSTPTTIRMRTGIVNTGGATEYCSFSCPVKKGDYYKVTHSTSQGTGGLTAAFFIPLS